jgi:hypothetical protein
MIVTACYCAARLAVVRSRRRATEVDADMLHTVMGVAMAGMLVPRLSPLPDGVWEALFGLAAAWFAWQAIRRGAAGGWRSAHPLPHLVESAAMIYMFAAVPSPERGAMAGMGRPAGSVLALAVVLALFMVGYVLWTADQLTAHLTAVRSPAVGGVAGSELALRGVPDQAGQLAGPALAPGLAACATIAMGVTMGYMLLVML